MDAKRKFHYKCHCARDNRLSALTESAGATSNNALSIRINNNNNNNNNNNSSNNNNSNNNNIIVIIIRRRTYKPKSSFNSYSDSEDDVSSNGSNSNDTNPLNNENHIGHINDTKKAVFILGQSIVKNLKWKVNKHKKTVQSQMVQWSKSWQYVKPSQTNHSKT